VSLRKVSGGPNIRNYSGLLTTFGGSQKFLAAGLAAAGGQARSQKLTRAAAGGEESNT